MRPPRSKHLGQTDCSLEGRRIAITRAKSQAGVFALRLEELGAHVIEIPAIRIEDVDASLVRKAIGHVDDYDIILFTSTNAVYKYFSYAGDTKLPLGSKSKTLGAIGGATADALRKHGFEPNLVPDTAVAESLAAAVMESGLDIKGTRILLPRALEARKFLKEALEKNGAHVSDVPVYKTVPEDFSKNKILMRELENPPDVIALTSPSTVKYLKLGMTQRVFSGMAGSSTAACIGPVTAEATRACGFDVGILPEDHSIPGLVDAIRQFFDNTARNL